MLSFIPILVTSHEEVHVAIQRLAGDNNARIELNAFGFLGGRTITYETSRDLTNAELAHSINEVVGYQVMPFLLVQTFVLAFICLGVFLILKKSTASND